MNYDKDYVGYEYCINCDVNRRFGVLIHQIIPDIYIHINDHQSKILALNYITKTILKFIKKDIILTPTDDKTIIDLIKKIVNKPVYNEYREEKVNEIKYIKGD